MAIQYPIPKPSEPLTQPGGLASRQWYNFWRYQLTISSGEQLQAEIDALTARVDAISSDDFTITGPQSVQVIGQPSGGNVTLQLSGDVQSPGNLFVYGTNGTGTKGWRQLASTSDLAEGTNLYFTEPRVRATVLTGISFASSATITAADSVLSAFGKLQAQVTLKEPAIAAGTTAQFWRGDKVFTDTLLGSLTLQTAVTPDITMKFAAAPTSGQSLFGFNGGDTTATQATINFRANETWTGTARGTRIDFRTTPNGTTALTMAATIQNPGAGFGTTTPNYTGFTTTVTVEGTTNSACEIASSRADAASVLIGAVSWNWRTASAGHQRIGEVQLMVDGTTANQRGGEIAFLTKPDASTTLTKRWGIGQAGHFLPATDNTYDVGSASQRVRQYFGAIGTINTSDERQKTDRGPLTPEELSAAADLARDITIYQMNDAIESKGSEARLHVGWMAQRVKSIMESHGLDGFRYGFLCYDEWEAKPEVWQEFEAVEEVWEWSEPVEAVVDEKTGEVISPAIQPIRGNLIREASPARRELIQACVPAGSLYGLRKDELTAFILAGQEQRIQVLERMISGE